MVEMMKLKNYYKKIIDVSRVTCDQLIDHYIMGGWFSLYPTPDNGPSSIVSLKE